MRHSSFPTGIPELDIPDALPFRLPPGCNNDNASGDDQHTAGSGAALLVVSGKPRQALLSWLSGHMVELPPLPTEVLKETMAFAFENHYQGGALMPVLDVTSLASGSPAFTGTLAIEDPHSIQWTT